MAFITNHYCSICLEDTEHMNDKCCKCLERKNDIDRKIKWDEFSELSTDEKLDYLYKHH